MLEELAKKDSKWYSLAVKICGDEELAKDLLQDAYLKIYQAQPEKICNGYVYRVIASIFVDSHRKKKLVTIPIRDYDIEYDTNTFEPDDFEKDVLNRFKQLNWVEQDLIRESYDRSLRQIEKQYPMITYTFAHRQITKSVKQVLGDNFETHYKNTRRK